MRGFLRFVVLTGLTLAVALVVAIPVGIALTPARDTTVAGQQLGIGATTPTTGWFGGWRGPASLKQIGQTVVDLAPIQVRGPLRPQIELGPLVQTDQLDTLLDPRHGTSARDKAVAAITGAFRAWYLLATLLVFAITVGIVGLITSVRIWFALARANREHAPLGLAEVWHREARQLPATAAVALVGTLAVWGALGVLAAHDTKAGLADVSSPRDLVGAAPVKLQATGPHVTGYAGAVIGDSRAVRLGGPIVPHADPDAAACKRSTDSLAAQLTQLSPSDPVRNLACSGASIGQGLLGEQQRGKRAVPPQVSQLMSMSGLQFVVVMIGPNDLDWTAFLKYCYAVPHCDDSLSNGQFDYRLAEFDRQYGDLLAALDALPGQPQIIVVGSYDVFAPGAKCADTQGPSGVPGLDAGNIELLIERNQQLNHVLEAGADAYHFSYVRPRLATLCQATNPEVGPDIQGLDDKHPFHPTAIGTLRIAASVFAAVGRGAE
jgi:hypothetical protein